MTRHEYQKRFGDFATAKEQEETAYSSLESAHLNKRTKRGACSGLELVANAPRRGQLASDWLEPQIEFMRQRAPESNTAGALAYIHGMEQALSMLRYYEDFNTRREGGEVEAWEDLAA